MKRCRMHVSQKLGLALCLAFTSHQSWGAEAVDRERQDRDRPYNGVEGVNSEPQSTNALCGQVVTDVREDEVTSLVRHHTDFALNLYKQLPDKGSNAVLSPFSISSTLTMALAGAREDTLSEMRTALQLASIPDSRLHASHAALAQELMCQPEAAYELVTANALWTQEGYRLQPSYIDFVQTFYAGGLQRVDFASATEEARTAINGWVADQTRGKISELLAFGAVSALTRMVVTNAVYYKGAWVSPFAGEGTKERPFWISDKATIAAPTMSQTAMLPYVETTVGDEAIQMAALPVLARDRDPTPAQEFVIILPDKRTGLAAVESALTTENLVAALDQLERTNVTINVPKFRFSAGFALRQALTALGMELAFDPMQANFTGLHAANEAPLFVGDVFHKGFIDFHEKGIEAAAATAAVMATTSLPPPPIEFNVNHPFMFMIVDAKTREVLFLGRVVDPMID